MTGGGTGSIVWTRRSALPLFVDDQPAALYRPRAVGSRKDVDPPPEALARRRCAFGGRDVVITRAGRAETSASGSGGRTASGAARRSSPGSGRAPATASRA